MEASEFRDDYAKFKKAGAVVLGASPDKPEAQKKFADKYKIPFPLLADTEKKLAQAFDVWKEKNMYGKKSMGVERTSFVIDSEGIIRHVFPKVKVDGHCEAVLTALKAAK